MLRCCDGRVESQCPRTFLCHRLNHNLDKMRSSAEIGHSQPLEHHAPSIFSAIPSLEAALAVALLFSPAAMSFLHEKRSCADLISKW